MAKKLPPPPEGKILVRSEAYGDHYRNERGSVTEAELNEAMKLSSELTPKANAYAKAVKDALDPFRKEFKDGTLWSRLVSLFKIQLGSEGLVDFKALEQFQCHKQYPLDRILHREITTSLIEEGKTLEVKALTYGGVKTRWEKAEEYRQILIVVFLANDLVQDVRSDTVYLPLGIEKRNEQNVRFSIPPGMILAMIALRCDFWSDGGPAGGQGRKGMEILKVLDLRNG